jgi:hypothetical protein
MVQQQFFNHLKFGDGIVGALSSLGTLHTFNADTYMCHINHIDIVSAVTYCARRITVLTEQCHHLLFLLGGHPTCNNRFTLQHQFQKLFRVTIFIIEQLLTCYY